MRIKSILKIWLQSVNWEIHFYKRMDGPITALQTLECDRSVHKFIEVNFSNLTESNQIFNNDFVAFIITSVKYHLKLLSANFFLSMISLKWALYNYLLNSQCLRIREHLIPKVFFFVKLCHWSIRRLWSRDQKHQHQQSFFLSSICLLMYSNNFSVNKSFIYMVNITN